MKKEFENMFLVVDVKHPSYGKVVVRDGFRLLRNFSNKISPKTGKAIRGGEVFNSNQIIPLDKIHNSTFGSLHHSVRLAIVQAYMVHGYKLEWICDLSGQGEMSSYKSVNSLVFIERRKYRFKISTQSDIQADAIRKKIKKLEKQLSDLESS